MMIKVCPKLTLWGPDGAPVPVKNVTAEVSYDGDRPTEFVLGFAMAPDEWAYADAAHLFHMTPDVRGDTFAGGFEPQPEIEIEARLDPDLLGLVAEKSADIFEAAALLLEADGPTAPLTRTEDWYGLVVKQQRGDVKTGFATTYSGLVD